jgi:hypothetical protein
VKHAEVVQNFVGVIVSQSVNGVVEIVSPGRQCGVQIHLLHRRPAIAREIANGVVAVVPEKFVAQEIVTQSRKRVDVET